VRAVVASRGRAERTTEEERLGGMEDGVSSGIVSVIACSASRLQESGSVDSPRQGFDSDRGSTGWRRSLFALNDKPAHSIISRRF